MAPFPEEVAAAPVLADPEYSILKQRVDLDIDFAGRSLKGSTEITVQPLVQNLKQIQLHCRQCRPTAIQAGGIRAKWAHDDPYRRSRMAQQSDVHQHEMLKSNIADSLRPAPQPELTITLPQKLKIQEIQADIVVALPRMNSTASLLNQESDMAIAETPTAQSANGLQFAPIKLSIEFEVASFRDGVHWIGHASEDRRFPYMYTKAEPWPGNTSCIFPCVDDATSRCSWEISIRSPKTLGDAFRISQPKQKLPNGHVGSSGDADVQMVNGGGSVEKPKNADRKGEDKYSIDLSEEDAALDLTIICIGDSVDDVVDTEDDTRHTVSFNLTQPVTARHVGFAIGPFEHVALSTTRGSDEEDRLGQSAVKIDGYCLPGKSKDLRNTCYPIPWAMDHMGVKYGSFPFSTFQLLFVDDFIYDTVATAGLSFCRSSLLFPKTVIEPMYRNTRILVRSLADQWMGVNVIAKGHEDEWVVAGIAGFMTDLYMKELAGNNEFRWQQKLAAEKVYDLDVDRPSISQLGALLHLDPTIGDFMNTKSALVLFILDRRLMKTTGQTGVHRIINKILLNAKTGSLVNGEVSTDDFKRTCERLGHNKLDPFFKQWVIGSGCPIFFVTQRFNKKKLVVEMNIIQRQLDRQTKPAFEPGNFMREVKEHVQEVWAPETNPVFTGPMTIRIHEADGTPYEHIVEIKEATTKLEIPYNTKYKRLKRSRRQKERQMAEGATAEGGDDTLLYCLGDILDTEEEKRDWNLIDWTAEDEERMGQESYEWIRMDADFEWIGKIHLVMPLYMYVSQLQQDRDIVAQYESMRYLLGSNPHHSSLSILVRTLMDSRYFWGIREMAAEGLGMVSKGDFRKIGEFHLTKAFRELFCIANTNMPKSNDFSDRRNFLMQCAIPRAMAKLRDADNKVPMEVRQFFVDLLKFNDNSNNKIDDGDVDNLTYSDNHYIATLMSCLADTLIASHREPQPSYSFSFNENDDEPLDPEESPDTEFEHIAIAQIERHRRIDEWDPSYQNIYSVTALDCLQRLTKAGIVKEKIAELMKYVRTGNSDNVRLAAWRCLSEIGVLRKMMAMRYLLHCIAEESSPEFRDGLLRVFGEALGHIALGESKPAPTMAQPSAESGLVLEQEESGEARRVEDKRKSSPDVAIVALKAALVNENIFKESLWHAATSPNIAIDEISALCDIAELIYEPVESFKLTLKMPRMWKCQHLGEGKIQFTSHGPFRQVPRKELGLADWQKMQKVGLKYSGPVSEEVVKERELAQADEAAALKAKIAQVEQKLQVGQSEPAPAKMLPPAVVPSTEKTGIKLSLGAKRKQSVDMTPRAASPKAPKLSRQQTPTGGVPSPRSKGSPAASQRRSTTPGSRPSKSKGKAPVVLRLGQHADRAQEILNSDPRPGRSPTPSQPPAFPASSRSITPASFPAGIVQSPTNSLNYFQSDPPQTMNLGSFRSYGPAPEVVQSNSPEVKQEATEQASSLATVPVAMNGHISPPPPPVVESVQEMPPPPKPKLTLKLGSRKNSIQGSPE